MKKAILIISAVLSLLATAADTLVVTGRVTAVYATFHILDAGDGPMLVGVNGNSEAVRELQGMIHPGDLVAETLVKDSAYAFLILKNLTTLGHDALPPPREISLEQLFAEGPFLTPVRIEGICETVLRDDTTTDSYLMTLRSGPARLQVTVVSADKRKIANFDRLLNAKIGMTGVYFAHLPSSLPYRGPVFVPTDPEATRIIDDNLPNPFAHPAFEEPKPLTPQAIAAMDLRTLTGTVLACWGENDALLESDEKRLHRLTLAAGSARPPVGARLQIVGQPETDLYRINFTSVRYRQLPSNAATPRAGDPPPLTDIGSIFQITNGKTVYCERSFGKTFRLRGTLLSRAGNGRLSLLVDGFATDVDTSGCPGAADGLAPGTTLEVTGVCILEIDNWRRDTLQSPIRGHFLVLRRAEDLAVVALPPWWTPARLALTCAGLLVLLLVILVWTLSLKRIVSRKEAELKREITARLASNLKIRERTRLAVELHDSIAQTLSGTAMEIGCAVSCAGNLSPEAKAHLQTASQTLRSCRDDLRDCLWDLRSNALEADTMDEAIRTTLRPILGDLVPTIRFNVLRKMLSDNTAHALLRIIHELVSNAIRHGHARTISIAGALEDRRILFSVRDDGCGFDPDHHPDTAEGHFGLEGIRERIRRFNGTLKISSAPGRGTKATLALDIRLPEEEDDDTP